MLLSLGFEMQYYEEKLKTKGIFQNKCHSNTTAFPQLEVHGKWGQLIF
jgi:hypothetical protein